MELKFKKLNVDAVLPKKAHEQDAGFDLVAVDDGVINHGFVEYSTGLSVEIPDGYVGLLFPRSSVTNQDLMLKNSVGVCDAPFRGEVKFRFHESPDLNSLITKFAEVKKTIVRRYKKGERIGQLVVLELPKFEAAWAEALTIAPRGTGGFGSSGK
jgi:dUTP pyrophosphatase